MWDFCLNLPQEIRDKRVEIRDGGTFIYALYSIIYTLLLMKTKLMYLLRFTLAYTHAEIKGLIVLLGMMAIYVFLYVGYEWREKEVAKLDFQPVVWEANYKAIRPKVFVTRKFGGKESGVRRKWVDYKSGGHKKIQAIDINTADSAAWVALNGIGPGFAKRIMTYREKLGGFYQVDQLKEV